MSTQKQLDIQSDDTIPINPDYIVTLTKGIKENFDKDNRSNCKVLKFSSNWSSDDILTKIYKLIPKSLPNLFIFIIEVQNIKKFQVSRITEKLIMFGKYRHVILQINADDSVPIEDRLTKILFKEDNSDEFLDTKGQKVTTTKNFYNFATFLWLCMNETSENFGKKVLKKLQKTKNSSIILKFLKVLKLPDQYFNELVLKYAAQGSKADFIIAIDAFVNDKGRLNFFDTKFITNTLIDYKSALYVAIQHSNKEVIEFLIKKCTNLIQQLPFKHQIEISSIALSTNQITVLCDLLNVADFPFPDDMKSLRGKTDKKLRSIMLSRIKLHKDVRTGDIIEVKKFIAENPNLKFGYSLKNISAISQSMSEGKYEVLFLLKANRYRDNAFENVDDDIDEDEDKIEAKKFLAVQRRENVNISTPDKDKSVLLLATRSFIYNRNDENKTEEEQREKIRKWYKDIEKTKLGSKLIDVSSQCNDLKIIYDFECDSVENIDVSKSQSTQGTTYPKSKWIFVGAKLTENKKREQEIKGVIAHEICHFVMRMVYKNNENPYYKDNIQAAKEFDIIVAEIESMLYPQQEPKDIAISEHSEEDEDLQFQMAIIEEIGIDSNVRNKLADDECDGIISSVYECYPKEDYHVELVVRPVHIQTQYDDEPETVAKLEEKYKKLFDFCEKVIIPELGKFNLKQRGTVETFNNFVGFLEEIQNLSIELATVKDMSLIFENNLVILSSNVPKLLKQNIYNFLRSKHGELLEVQNIFIDPKCLQSCFVTKNFKEILQEQKNLSIFVDCSRELISNIDFIAPSEELRFFFIVSSDNDSLILNKRMEGINLSYTLEKLQYNWNDLTKKCQVDLLNTKVNFQNDSKTSLFELISNESNTEDQNIISPVNSAEIIDDQLLNLLLGKSKIQINAQFQEEINELKFKILFQARRLVENYKVGNILMPNDVAEVVIARNDGTITRRKLSSFKTQSISFTDDASTLPKVNNTKPVPLSIEFVDSCVKLSFDQLLANVKNMTYVLISDKAGSGKSWIFKNIANKLQEKFPTNWITYVDLKQFIKEFKAHNSDIDFAKFMIDDIIKPKTKYEAKIFEKLYKNGKVCILFDGFDEIAPDYAEFVTKLFQSFQQNGGNQLWIATRDYFEKDLKDNLGLDTVYKLDEFTEKHGVELIVFTWILSELSNDLDYQSEIEIYENILKHPNFVKYKEIATKLSKKVPKSQTSSIGLPQFYKIIADVSIDNKNAVINYTTFKLFEECVNIQYERWSKEKGELNRQEYIRSQHKDLNFHKLHQLIAMKSLFPKDSKFCDLELETLNDWKEQQIVACGYLNKIGDEIFFLQQTFREFFAADFILRLLTRQGLKLDENLCKYLIQFLTTQKFMIIRMFLNEALVEKSTYENIENKIPKIADNFCTKVEKLQNLSYIFEEKLGNLAEILFKIFQKGNYKQISKILNKNSNIIQASSNQKELFIKVTDFIVKYFKSSDLRKFIADNQIIISIFATPLDIKIIDGFLEKIEDKTDLKFVSDSLQARNNNGENLLSILIQSKHLNTQKFKYTLYLLQKQLKDPKCFTKVIKECNNDNWNALHVAFDQKDVNKMKIVWAELEQCFFKSLDQFRDIFTQKTTKLGQNILHIAANCQKIEFHQALWENLHKLYFILEESTEAIFQKDNSDNNFICALLIHNKADIIDLTFQNFEKIFQNTEIFMSTGNLSRNLLQIAASASMEIKTHQILWNYHKESCKTNEKFLDVLKAVDINGSNVFRIAIKTTTSEIFEFMVQELEKIATNEEIKIILNNSNYLKKNVLQLAAKHNKSLEFHKSLWKIIQKYFNATEIISIMQHTDMREDNFFYLVLKFNKKEVIEFSWNQIMLSMDKSNMKYFSEKKLRKYSQMNKLNPEVEKWCDDLLSKYNFKSNSCYLM